MPFPYHSNEELEAAVRRHVARAGPRAALAEVGRSAGDVPIVAATVAAPGRVPERDRPQALVTANIHGAEVIASEVALGIIGLLVADPPADPAAGLLSVADVTVIAVVNPDSRQAALNRVRRGGPLSSSRRTNGRGVDLNRNFPYPLDAPDVWHPVSGTPRPWLPWYRGERPLSEPEAAAIAGVARDLRPFAAVHLHSCGRLFLYPYSRSRERPPDEEAFRAMGEAFRRAQPRWQYGVRQTRSWYTILGSLDDYLYDELGVLSCTVEISALLEAVRDAPWRIGHLFWWANPSDPAAYVKNDASACLAALLEGYRQRIGAA